MELVGGGVEDLLLKLELIKVYITLLEVQILRLKQLNRRSQQGQQTREASEGPRDEG